MQWGHCEAERSQTTLVTCNIKRMCPLMSLSAYKCGPHTRWIDIPDSAQMLPGDEARQCITLVNDGPEIKHMVNQLSFLNTTTYPTTTTDTIKKVGNARSKMKSKICWAWVNKENHFAFFLTTHFPFDAAVSFRFKSHHSSRYCLLWFIVIST